MGETQQRKKVKKILFIILAVVIIAAWTNIKDAFIISLTLAITYLVYSIVWNNISWGKPICGCGCSKEKAR